MFAFANPWLLWLFPALALPWIFRRRRQEQIQHVDFPLLHFLKESEEKEFINPQLQELLLLILRTLLLALLLLALAGPRWTAPPALSAAAAWLPFSGALQKQIIALDASYSMGFQEGDRSWWMRAATVWERVGAGVSGMGAHTVRWDKRSVDPARAHALLFLSSAQASELLQTPPAEPGASFSELMAVLQPRLDGDERLLVITDGQRWPWEDLLGASPASIRIPPTLVVTVGDDPVWNAWCELDYVSSTPWGLAEWETISGRIGMLGEPAVDEGVLSIMNERTGERLYSRPIQFSTAIDQPGYIPFSFTASQAEYQSADFEETGDASLAFAVMLEPNDFLPIDNRLPIEISLSPGFDVGVVESGDEHSTSWQVLYSTLRLWAGEEATSSLSLQVYPSHQPIGTPDQDLLILPPGTSAWWTPQHTSDLMEYLRVGGEVILFTGGEEIAGGWSELLQSLDWIWLDQEVGERSDINIIGSGSLANSLSLWEETFWRVWTPALHGRFDLTAASEATPLAVYSTGDESATLIGARSMGAGRAWIINSPLTVESGVLLSPLFPVITWELAKATARRTEGFSDLSVSPRRESNLTLLNEDDKALLAERYGVRFIPYDELNERTLRGEGAMDLRLALLAACLILALMESWLANRLASL